MKIKERNTRLQFKLVQPGTVENFLDWLKRIGGRTFILCVQYEPRNQMKGIGKYLPMQIYSSIEMNDSHLSI